jgi:hypothetical protein
MAWGLPPIKLRWGTFYILENEAREIVREALGPGMGGGSLQAPKARLNLRGR